jgi:hypothetical protein
MLSLSQPLQTDEVLGVAFQYTYNGRIFQVGEFSQDVPPDSSSANQKILFLKLLESQLITYKGDRNFAFLNLDKIHEKKNKKYICQCSGKYTECHKAHHFKTPKHQNWLIVENQKKQLEELNQLHNKNQQIFKKHKLIFTNLNNL